MCCWVSNFGSRSREFAVRESNETNQVQDAFVTTCMDCQQFAHKTLGGNVTNALRMSFGEWLCRMSEADVPPAARNLAIYAAVLDVTGNDELAKLAGLEDANKHAASRTYDKWKKQLLTDGWVLVSRRDGGRGIGIEVHPAVRQTPVEFTDVLRRNPRKIYPRKDCQTPAKNTPVKDETSAIFAGVSKESFPHTPFKEKTSLPRTTVENNNLGHQQSVAVDSSKIDPHVLFEKMAAAANGALSPVAVGLNIVSEPIGWIEHGADLEKDILPVIASLGHKAKPRSIQSWAYFRQAVSQAKDARLRGLPTPIATPAAKPQKLRRF